MSPELRDLVIYISASATLVSAISVALNAMHANQIAKQNADTTARNAQTALHAAETAWQNAQTQALAGR